MGACPYLDGGVVAAVEDLAGLHGLDGRRHGRSGSRSWSRVAWLGEEAEIESDQSRWSGVQEPRPSRESEWKGSRRRWGLRGNFSELERMAAEAWALGAKAWEEASAFSGDVDAIVSGDGAAVKCPTSLELGGGGEGETAAFLPCGLAVGSAVTVVATPREAVAEYVEALERSGSGNGTVMVAQFAVELRGAGDGDAATTIHHLNPRLRGDWSGRPVVELNTRFRGQWGPALRCEGWRRSDEDTGASPALHTLTQFSPANFTPDYIPR